MLLPQSMINHLVWVNFKFHKSPLTIKILYEYHAQFCEDNWNILKEANLKKQIHH